MNQPHLIVIDFAQADVIISHMTCKMMSQLVT